MKLEEYDESNIVYEKGEFIVMKVRSDDRVGYIVHNTNKKWEEGHTHLKSFNMAKELINNVTKHKKPKTSNGYLLMSHIRVTNDESYERYIRDLMYSKRGKSKQVYRNRSC